MGDRCFLSITLLKKDLCALAASFHDDEESLVELCSERDNGAVCIEFDEINYGGYDELRDLAQKGVVFLGWHGAGCEYLAGEFCGLKGVYYEWPEVGGDYIMAISRENPRGSDKQAAEFIKYLAAYDKVSKAFGATNNSTELPEDTP